MGSIDKEEVGMGVSDCVVGSIVWVRRRNGSWWPGKILGAAELSAANLVSQPKSGTPVKLLGREDASVDWYNMEKSKRVKPFRCGEFDECIERAESALGMPPKKREKYARREDAILHALELEKQLLDSKTGSLVSPVDGHSKKYFGMVKKEPVISSKCSIYHKNYKPRFKNLVVAAKEEYIDEHICPLEVNEVNQMRGSLHGPRKSELDSLDSDLSITGVISDNKTTIPRTRGSLDKKRKLPNVIMKKESPVKRRDRRRPLVQVLKKSENEQKSHTKMSRFYLPSDSNDCSEEEKLVRLIPRTELSFHEEMDSFSHPTDLDEESGSESTESTETDSSKTHSIDSSKDAEMTGLAEPAPDLETKSHKISGQIQRSSVRIKLLNDNDITIYPHNHVPACLGVSKWQIKGKRNKRTLTKRSTNATDRWVARGSMYTADLQDVESDGFDETGNMERSFRTQGRSYYNQRLANNHSIINWEDLALNDQPLRTHLNPMVDSHQFGGRTKIGLLDVDLKVRSSYQKEHVPLISLRSKLNGKAIVGHPIQVEILDNGSTDSLIFSANGISHFQNVNHSKNTPFKKPIKGICDVIISKKLPKQTSLSSNEKIRNLSAIGMEQRYGNSFRNGDKNSFRAGGLMKGEVGQTTVACIPVKLVFSRLNEELVGRHQ